MAFHDIKKAIVEAPSLHPFDSKGSNIVTVDASAVGIGAVFTQRVKGREQTVAFISRRLRNAERFYSTIERETLACVWAIEKLKMYLWGNHFELVTDHKPLTFMMDGFGRGNGRASLRRVRLLAKLQEFHFKIKHVWETKYLS